MTHGGFDDTTEDAYEEGRPMLNTSQRDRPDEVRFSLLTSVSLARSSRLTVRFCFDRECRSR